MPNPEPSVRSSALRVRIEHASAPLLARLARVPPVVLVGAALALAVLGAAARGLLGAVCFGLLTALVGWLFYLSWPRLGGLERLMRASVLLLTSVLTLVLAAGR